MADNKYSRTLLACQKAGWRFIAIVRTGGKGSGRRARGGRSIRGRDCWWSLEARS